MSENTMQGAMTPVEQPTARAAKIIGRCRALAQITDVAGGTTRTFLSAATHEVHHALTQWMEAAGLCVHADAAGNLRGVRTATTRKAPRLLIGSHIDTVPNAGAYDGVLGVMLGLALVEEITPETPLPFEIELVAFSEEEGVRFAKPFLGSLALIGQLDEETLRQTDSEAVDVATAIRNFGLDPAGLSAAVAHPLSAAYLEFHIEQGPVLEAERLGLGVVAAIVGQTRLTLTFTGQSNHAGTTPMGSLRRDALAAAAEWVVEVERYAGTIPGLVATVGRLDVPGGAGNVIAGKAVATLDARHSSDSIRHAAVHHLLQFASRCSAARRISVEHTITLEQAAVLMDPRLTRVLADAVTDISGTPARTMASGAGHDAMIVARRIPSAMLFLRTPGGLSHHPEEAVLPGDVEVALAAGLEFLARLRQDSTILATPGCFAQESHDA
ncbi:MAG: allantoate amidohydrolase [Acidobacteriaceae bacterium]